MNPLFKFTFKCGLTYNGTVFDGGEVFTITVVSRNLPQAKERVLNVVGSAGEFTSTRWMVKVLRIEEIV